MDIDKTILKALISKSKKSKILDLSHQNLISIPQEVLKAKSIQVLLLNNNKISVIPPELCKMNLRVLDLSNNKIKHLPDVLCNMKTLERLDVSNNRLTKIPGKFYQLCGPYKRKLWADNNPQITNDYHELYDELCKQDDEEEEYKEIRLMEEQEEKRKKVQERIIANREKRILRRLKDKEVSKKQFEREKLSVWKPKKRKNLDVFVQSRKCIINV